jgi:hypothetical protein
MGIEVFEGAESLYYLLRQIAIRLRMPDMDRLFADVVEDSKYFSARL